MDSTVRTPFPDTAPGAPPDHEVVAVLEPEDERYLADAEPSSETRADGELPDDELPDAELPDAELPDDELPDAELLDAELPDDELFDAELLDEAWTAMQRGLVDAGDLAEEEAGRATAPGVSPLALAASKQWDAGDRPTEWIGRVFGLVVHTTGGDLPAKARAKGVYHTVEAVDHYSRSHGCHYVNGWRGVAGGDLLQVANEREQAAGVGVTNAKHPNLDQRRSIEAGRFEADLPPILVRLWRERWPGREHSLQLLPGTRTANSCYVHVECVPCVYSYRKKRVTDAEPMRDGLRFTRAQHDTVALLACDIARRNGWPATERWWRTPRLLGHEDLTPISRHDSRGGWDPGYLREAPYFDWDHVYATIEKILSGDPAAPALPATSRPTASILSVLGTAVDQFRSFLINRRETSAVELALDRGVRSADDLTNLVFFARHPEMDGRRIRPDEKHLAREWLEIRRNIVEPVLMRRG
jgi:N-acetylmuramoyl-L-alanine amidase